MNCKKCGHEWQSYGEALTCPACGTAATLTQTEKQTLWEQAYEAEHIRDMALRARCYLKLAEQGDAKAQFAYGECKRRGEGVAQNEEEAVFWYKASARRLSPVAAYRLAMCLAKSPSFGDGTRQAFFWLRVGAELGDAEAAYELSRVYEEGRGVDASHRHALYWLMTAARRGQGEACATLAKMYFEGNGVEKNNAVARYFLKKAPSGLRTKWLALRLGAGDCTEPAELFLPEREEERLVLGRQAENEGEYAIASYLYFIAAKGGSDEAASRLGRFYEEGLGVPKSTEEARRRYGIAAKAGNANALLHLGLLAEGGEGGDADGKTALECYTRLEEKGDAEGAFHLGEMYRKGALLPKDYPEAIRHYKLAARLGHRGAEAALEGLRREADAAYEKGRMAEDIGDMTISVTQYRFAAEMGHAAAAYTMGLLCERSATCAKDRREAVSYYTVAAESGHVGGICRLGLCYSRGFGVARDYAKANSLLSIAAKQNDAEAAGELAALKARRYRRVARRFYSIATVLYRKGNVSEAIQFRNIAAKLGSVRAMYMLGCHFEFGDGVSPDRIKANAWYNRAVSMGFDPAKGDIKGGYLRERKKLILTKIQ